MSKHFTKSVISSVYSDNISLIKDICITIFRQYDTSIVFKSEEVPVMHSIGLSEFLVIIEETEVRVCSEDYLFVFFEPLIANSSHGVNLATHCWPC